MDEGAGQRFIQSASAVLSGEEARLLALLHQFTGQRLAGADRRRRNLLELPPADERTEGELHSFARECWAALDGLARELNVCLAGRYPAARLYPPKEMTRQCTFYVVRKKLHECPETADLPITRLLWEQTREMPPAAYERLSFLYNVSLFLPVPVREDGRMPGAADLPAAAGGLIKHPAAGTIEPCWMEEGLEGILRWLNGFLEDCYRLVCDELDAA